MLLNEFLKGARQNGGTGSDHCPPKAGAASDGRASAKQIEALTAGLQKVSAQLAATGPSCGGLQMNKFATGRIRRGGSNRNGSKQIGRCALVVEL
jgi:hypothetical protein